MEWPPSHTQEPWKGIKWEQVLGQATSQTKATLCHWQSLYGSTVREARRKWHVRCKVLHRGVSMIVQDNGVYRNIVDLMANAQRHHGLSVNRNFFEGGEQVSPEIIRIIKQQDRAGAAGEEKEGRSYSGFTGRCVWRFGIQPCVRKWLSSVTVGTLRCYSATSVLAVGRVFASASSDPPSNPSGPVRYVQKQLPNKEPNGSRKSAALETRTKGWRSIQPDPSNEEKYGESNSPNERGYPNISRGTGKSSSNSRLSTASPAAEGSSTTRPHIDRKDEAEEGGQSTTNLELDAGESLFGDGLKIHAEDVQVGKQRGQITDKDSRTNARNYVMGLLARGPQTELNLRSKLVRKNVPPEVIDETINDLQRWGLQSDEEYAEVFAHSRWTDNTWGPKRIKYELLRRGIRKETVEAALVKLFQTSDTVESQEEEDLGKWGMTTQAAEHLIAQARRRWCQGDVKIEVKRRRMIGWLQRRGFPWSIIPDVLKIIESEEPT